MSSERRVKYRLELTPKFEKELHKLLKRVHICSRDFTENWKAYIV